VSNQYNEALITGMLRVVKTSNVDRNQQLFSSVVTGSLEARTRMIEDNMPLVITRVDTFIRIHPNLNYLRDDMTSAGFCGLIGAVDNIQTGVATDATNITAYLSTAVQRAIRDLVVLEVPILVPGRTQRLARANGGCIQVAEVVNGVLDTQTVDAKFIEEVDLRNLFESCCECEEERTFLAMREAGYTYQEIATLLGTSPSSVKWLSDKLEARIMETIAQDGQLPVCEPPIPKLMCNRKYYQAHRAEILARFKVRRQKTSDPAQ